MASIGSDETRAYRSIAASSVAAEQQANSGSSHILNPVPFIRRTSTLLGLAFAFSATAFVAGRQFSPVTQVWTARPANVIPHALNHIRVPGIYPYSVMTSPLHSVTPQYSAIRSDAADTDFSLDERVPTYQCGTGRVCRARLTVIKQGNHVFVKAGYQIYGRSGAVKMLGNFVKKNLRETTDAKRLSWASKLLAAVSDKLDEVNCKVSESAVATAIGNAQNTVVNCPKTDDPRCNTMIPVEDCDLTPPVPSPTEEQCTEYVRSNPTISDFSDLKAGCEGAKSFHTRLWAPLPLCTTECPSNPGVKHTVYSYFYVQANSIDISKRQTCMAKMYARAYNLIYPSVPSCNSPKLEPDGRGLYILGLASTSKRTMPKELISMGKANGCDITYGYFMDNLKSLESIISNSCASAS